MAYSEDSRQDRFVRVSYVSGSLISLIGGYRDEFGEERALDGPIIHINSEEAKTLIKELESAIGRIRKQNADYLKKHMKVVKDFQRGASFAEVIQAHNISRSTAQNIKRTAKAANLI